MRGCFPDDPIIENMDPVMKAWMFYNWIEDFGDENKMLENQAMLIGSFTNPELVQKILGHGVSKSASSDEEFEQTSRLILEADEQAEKEKQKARKRKRKRKIEE
jgi:hypothetical protein